MDSVNIASDLFDASQVYGRQVSIPLSVPTSVMCIGCGGVGSWAALFLALAGVHRLLLFDSDKVSPSNLNRTPFTPNTIDQLKTEALRALILSVRPHCEVECYPNFNSDFAKSLYMDNPNWAIVSTDTWRSRKDAYRFCLANGIIYVEAAAEGDSSSISAEPAEWATIEEENPSYASVPVWVGPAIAAAHLACAYILHGAVPTNGVTRMDWDDEKGSVKFFVK